MLPWIAGGWIGGLFVGVQWWPSFGPLLLGGALLCALLLAHHGDEVASRLWVGPLALLAALCGLGVSAREPTPCTFSGEVAGTARVESVRHGETDARIRMRLVDARDTVRRDRAVGRGQRVEGRLADGATPSVGTLVSFRADLRPRTELRNPSPHPELRPPRRTCWAHFRRLDVVETSRLRSWVVSIRSRVRSHLMSGLPEDAGAVTRALVLGDAGALGYERRQVIAAVGLAHLFAVSGLHIALVSGSVVAALRWLSSGWTIGFDGRRLAAAFGVPLTLAHAALAGGSPSAWRAAITAAMTWALVAFGKRPTPRAVTAVAALTLSVPDPSMALRPAFLLSIIATAAILTAPRVSGRARWLRSAGLISARTLVATAPMVWWWFGGVPLIGWVTNIIVLPFGSWVIIPLAHLFALSAWAEFIEPPLASLLTFSVRLLLQLCEALSPLAVTRRLPPLDAVQGCVVLAGCTLLLAARTWRSRAFVLTAAAALWFNADRAIIEREHPRDRLRVTFIDVGQGDAALIDFPDGRAALVDTGQGGRHPAGRELGALLDARRRTRLDLVVITHGHPDHFGGLEALLDERAVGELWLNAQLVVEERDGTMEQLVNRALSSGTKVRFAPDLCEIKPDFGGVSIEVLWPCPRYDPALDLNDNSLTLRVQYGRRVFLLTGDLESEAENRLLDLGWIDRADVLKVAHHGSRTSTTSKFVETVRPSVAVISSGAGNRYGHPSAMVLSRLRRAGARVLRTDHGGGVIISTDGEHLEIRR